MSTVPTDEQWALEDRREFLLRSLADADREHAAGDLGDVDHRRIRTRDESDLASVEARLEVLVAATKMAAARVEAGESESAESDGDAPRSNRGRHLWLLISGLVALAAGAVVLLLGATANRLPGEFSSGGITSGGAAAVSEQLAQATSLVAAGKTGTALQLYNKVLVAEPKNPVALASAGWIEWNVGLRSNSSTTERVGRREVTTAVRVTPGSYPARYYLGAIDLDVRDVTDAISEFQAFLSDNPSSTWLQGTATTLRQAFTQAGQPVPAAVPAAVSPPPNS